MVRKSDEGGTHSNVSAMFTLEQSESKWNWKTLQFIAILSRFSGWSSLLTNLLRSLRKVPDFPFVRRVFHFRSIYRLHFIPSVNKLPNILAQPLNQREKESRQTNLPVTHEDLVPSLQVDVSKLSLLLQAENKSQNVGAKLFLQIFLTQNSLISHHFCCVHCDGESLNS